MTTSATMHPPRESASTETLARVLIADKFEAKGVEDLKKLGCQVELRPDAQDDALVDIVKSFDPQILIVRSTKVREPVLKAAKNLALIVRAGAGYDNIDVDTASARGIFVANCPGKNAIAVAELAWGLILACDRRIPDQTGELREGKWNKKEYAKARGLHGRTLGIVGLGTIGREVARRGRAFGMKIVAWSRSLTPESAEEFDVQCCTNLINLAKMSDVISVNVAATNDTSNLIDAKFCDAMKPDAYLINTSRGSVVDEAALLKAINEKGVRAGLDVYANEPGPSDSAFTGEIARTPGVYGTHHIGASTDQAQNAIADETVRIVRTFLEKGQVPNAVNRAERTLATCLLTVRHLNRPGVLAHIFYTLGQSGINVEEMENVIYTGEEAACARIQLASCPSENDLAAINRNEHVLSVELTTLNQ